MPAQVEVEHHLVNNFADGLMKAGVVFPFVRWCNPGNSQEKRAEHEMCIRDSINTDIGIRLVGFRNHILKSKKGTGHLIPSPVINNSL